MSAIKNHRFNSGATSTALIAGILLATLIATTLTLLLLRARTPEQRFANLAETYVSLTLALAWHRDLEVDSYLGPASLDQRQQSAALSLPELETEAKGLLTAVKASTDYPDQDRVSRLTEKVGRLVTLLQSLTESQGLSFADELSRLYGLEISSQELGQEFVQNSPEELEALEQLLPGRGTLEFRVAAFRNQMLIPADKRAEVFEAALAECRHRTLSHWQLPDNEMLTIEWTRDVPAAWHHYQGNGQSLLRINDLSIGYLDSAIDIACHEGYPGHHAQFTMLESQQSDLTFALEDSVFLLRSPDSAIREGAANFGISLVFPAQERMAFERDVLAKIAGITMPEESVYLRFNELVDKLALNSLPIISQYLSGESTFNKASNRLQREALIGSPDELLTFAEEYGAYAVSYTLAQQRIAQYVEANNLNVAESWDYLAGLVINLQSRM